MPQTYVSPNEFMGSMPAIAAGKTGTPRGHHWRRPLIVFGDPQQAKRGFGPFCRF